MSQRQDRVIPTCWMSNSWVRCRRPVYPSICLGQPGWVHDDIHHKGEAVSLSAPAPPIGYPLPAEGDTSGGGRYLGGLCVRVKHISVRCANGSPFAPTFFGRGVDWILYTQCIPTMYSTSAGFLRVEVLEPSTRWA
jgi:hypothetical protein